MNEGFRIIRSATRDGKVAVGWKVDDYKGKPYGSFSVFEKEPEDIEARYLNAWKRDKKLLDEHANAL